MTTKTHIGKLAVRRSIEINATPERVWQEFASQERMALWFSDKGGVPMGNQRLTYEPRVGGTFQTEGLHGGVTPFLFTGKVLVLDPPRELTAEMGMVKMGEDPAPWPAPTLITFLISPLGDGRAQVEIIHHGFEALGDLAQEMYEGFEGGWNLAQLTALRNLIDTGKATG
jgi:uncharacterized protein YndB with AHSA1/START domain